MNDNNHHIIRAKSIFLNYFNYLQTIIKDKDFLMGQCNLEGTQQINSNENAEKLYFQESYYELLCDVPYETQEFKEHKTDIKVIDMIQNMELEFHDKIYTTIRNRLKQDVLHKLHSTLFNNERFLDAIIEDFSRFFSYVTISAYGEATLKSDFLELQLNIYKNGGFPCGWVGIYPKGNMCVYTIE